VAQQRHDFFDPTRHRASVAGPANGRSISGFGRRRSTPPRPTAARGFQSTSTKISSPRLVPQGGCVMSKANQIGRMTLCGIAVLLAAGVSCFAQAPNPYRPVRGLADGGGPSTPGGEWAKLPGGREMGPPASVHVDIDGESIWALIRCDETSPVPAARGGRFGLDCMLPDGRLKPHDTIYKFDPKGNVVRSFGAGMFIWPHGMHIDRDGNA
jgi:hypothetical protein